MIWPGGKNGAGVYQRIINHMPPHRTYIEAFLGSGAVMRHKRPAALNIGIDRSVQALDTCRALAGDRFGDGQGAFRLLDGDALALLPSLTSLLTDSVLIDAADTLIYADPPYLMQTRKGGALYEFEMDDAGHERLLAILTEARCMVMISGYRSGMYDTALRRFHRVSYQANTRGGLVDETLWMNFAPPVALHDYGHLGSDYRERERIKRKTARWAAKIARMDRQERLAIMDVLTRQGEDHGTEAG